MAVDPKVVDDLSNHIDRMVELKKYLDTLYYSPEFATFFNRPIIAALVSAAEYLQKNLINFRDRYIQRHTTPGA